MLMRATPPRYYAMRAMLRYCADAATFTRLLTDAIIIIAAATPVMPRRRAPLRYSSC